MPDVLFVLEVSCWSASLSAGRAIKDVLNVVEMALVDVLAVLEPISENGCARAAHHTELPRQLRQISHGAPWRLRRCLWHLRHLSAASLRHLRRLCRAVSGRAAKHIAQNLAEDVAARNLLRSGRSRRVLVRPALESESGRRRR
jgi:hypothetical protein